MLSRVRDTLQRASVALEQVQAERQILQKENQQADQERQQAGDSRAAFSAEQQAKIKKVAAWLESMPEAFAGEFLKHEVNNGKLKAAAEVLAAVQDRKAAKILYSMGESALVSQLTDEFMKLQLKKKER